MFLMVKPHFCCNKTKPLNKKKTTNIKHSIPKAVFLHRDSSHMLYMSNI